jgi:hypothetical protein
MSSQLETIKKNIFIVANLRVPDPDDPLAFIGSSSFEKRIDLNFLPDEMIVKYIHYQTYDGTLDGVQDMIAYIYSNITNEIMGSFAANTRPNGINLFYQLMRKPLNGLFRFELKDITGAPVSKDGHMVIALEFIQYNNKKYVL